MGDRYELDKECVYCGKLNQEIWFAPTCNSLTFKCEKCKKTNFITTDLDVKKLEEVTYEDVFWAIDNASNMMNKEQITKCAKEYFKSLKRRKNNGSRTKI